MKRVKVLSLFDGISCGRAALGRAGIPVSEYAAFEIDKHATAISRFNYPDIKRFGDVLTADFSMFAGFDMVIGGSPCNFWSCAKGKDRELDKSGTGWLLFSRFAGAVRAVRPKWYLYENVASMPPTIKAYISGELGAEPVMINSALVSAQHRKRFYWTNIPGVGQPDDRGVMLEHILQSGVAAGEKSYCMAATYNKAEIRNTLERKQRTMVFELAPLRVGDVGSTGQGHRVYSIRGKSICLASRGGGGGALTGLYQIGLPDGEYTVRKLTPVEAERCQTLPDGYTFMGADSGGNTVKISNLQRYRTIGNGWTVEVIAHILSYINAKPV